jgi:hypothetical protein
VINRLTFARIRWQETEPKNQRYMRGFVYVARDGDTIIYLSSQDLTDPERRRCRWRMPPC